MRTLRRARLSGTTGCTGYTPAPNLMKYCPTSMRSPRCAVASTTAPELSFTVAAAQPNTNRQGRVGWHFESLLVVLEL